MRTVHLICVLVLFAATLLCESSSGQSGPSNLNDLPNVALSSISSAQGRDIPPYHAHAAGDGFEVANPRQRLTIDFASRGLEVRNGEADWKILFAGYGYGDSLTSAEAVAPEASLNRLQYRRKGITEWYINGPAGLEQGFTVDRPPGKASGQPLSIALLLSGNLNAVDDGRDGLILATAQGQAELQYTGFSACDASGKELRAWLKVEGKRMLLQVADHGARYPLVIDPWVRRAKLEASDGHAGDDFGYSVAISSNTVVVGAPRAPFPTATGAVYVFEKLADGWVHATQAAKLTASDGGGSDYLGYSVAISGNKIVAGAPLAEVGSNYAQGAAYVFVKPASGWTDMTETAKLTASNGAESDLLGYSVGISGHNVALGAPYATSSHEGAVYLFAEGAKGWTTRSHFNAELITSHGSFEEFGLSVAINGNAVVAGADAATIDEDPDRGAIYLFARPPSGWRGQILPTARLTASDGQRGDRLGFSVSLSGNTVLGGAFQATIGSNKAQGAAYVFVKPTSGWPRFMTQTAKLTASDGAAYDWFGYSLFVESHTVIIGVPNADIGSAWHRGTAYIFTQPASGWRTTSNFNQKLTAPVGPGSNLGWSVGLVCHVVVAGAPQIDADAPHEAAFVYGKKNSTR